MSGRFTNLPERLRASAAILATGDPLEWMKSLTIQSQLEDAAIKIEALDRESASTPDPAQIRADALREALAVDWSHGTDVFDKAPEFLTPWQRGLVAGQAAMRDAIRAMIDSPLSPTAVDGSPAPNASGKEGV